MVEDASDHGSQGGEYHQVEALFQQAADLPAKDRRVFLDQNTPPGSEIRREVDALLAHLDDESFHGFQVTDEGLDGGVPDLEQLGPYRLLHEIGRGGMGVVYLAEDTRLHRNVALKVLTAFGARSRSLRARLIREAKAASKLDHPAISKVYEVGEAEGYPFIAMQHGQFDFVAGLFFFEGFPQFHEIIHLFAVNRQQDVAAHQARPGCRAVGPNASY